MIPDRNQLLQKSTVFTYVRVNGVWEDQQNKEEADTVAALVLLHTRQQPEMEIGVITFNHPQQELIVETIEETFQAAGVSIPGSLMVKNIENVQGDEKDIIIFSVGYAPARNNQIGRAHV